MNRIVRWGKELFNVAAVLAALCFVMYVLGFGWGSGLKNAGAVCSGAQVNVERAAP